MALKMFLLLLLGNLSVVQTSFSEVTLSWLGTGAPTGSTIALASSERDDDAFAANTALTATRDAASFSHFEDETDVAEAAASLTLNTSFDGSTFTSSAIGYAENSRSASSLGTSGFYSASYRLWIMTDEPIWFHYSIGGSPLGIDGINEIGYFFGGAFVSGAGSVLIESGMEVHFRFTGYANSEAGGDAVPYYTSNSSFSGSFNSVPEPSTYFLVACGVGLLLWRMRCHRRA